MATTAAIRPPVAAPEPFISSPQRPGIPAAIPLEDVIVQQRDRIRELVSEGVRSSQALSDLQRLFESITHDYDAASSDAQRQAAMLESLRDHVHAVEEELRLSKATCAMQADKIAKAGEEWGRRTEQLRKQLTTLSEEHREVEEQRNELLDGHRTLRKEAERLHAALADARADYERRLSQQSTETEEKLRSVFREKEELMRTREEELRREARRLDDGIYSVSAENTTVREAKHTLEWRVAELDRVVQRKDQLRAQVERALAEAREQATHLTTNAQAERHAHACRVAELASSYEAQLREVKQLYEQGRADKAALERQHQEQLRIVEADLAAKQDEVRELRRTQEKSEAQHHKELLDIRHQCEEARAAAVTHEANGVRTARETESLQGVVDQLRAELQTLRKELATRETHLARYESKAEVLLTKLTLQEQEAETYRCALERATWIGSSKHLHNSSGGGDGADDMLRLGWESGGYSGPAQRSGDTVMCGSDADGDNHDDRGGGDDAGHHTHAAERHPASCTDEAPQRSGLAKPPRTPLRPSLGSIEQHIETIERTAPGPSRHSTFVSDGATPLAAPAHTSTSHLQQSHKYCAAPLGIFGASSPLSSSRHSYALRLHRGDGNRTAYPARGEDDVFFDDPLISTYAAVAPPAASSSASTTSGFWWHRGRGPRPRSASSHRASAAGVVGSTPDEHRDGPAPGAEQRLFEPPLPQRRQEGCRSGSAALQSSQLTAKAAGVSDRVGPALGEDAWAQDATCRTTNTTPGTSATAAPTPLQGQVLFSSMNTSWASQDSRASVLHPPPRPATPALVTERPGGGGGAGDPMHALLEQYAQARVVSEGRMQATLNELARRQERLLSAVHADSVATAVASHGPSASSTRQREVAAAPDDDGRRQERMDLSQGGGSSALSALQDRLSVPFPLP